MKVSVRQVRESEREFVDLKFDSVLLSGECHNFFKVYFPSKDVKDIPCLNKEIFVLTEL